jgi:hypothetical protein
MRSTSFERRDRGDHRDFLVEGELWSVTERDAKRVPGARAPTSLIFESQAAVRRAWSFPSNWRDMEDDALWRLSELTASKSALMEALQRTFITSIVAQRVASELIGRARDSLEENRAVRKEREEVILHCRAARRDTHFGVADYARQARAEGASESEVLHNLDAPLQHTAFVMNDPQRSERLASDVARWCDEEFRAA